MPFNLDTASDDDLLSVYGGSLPAALPDGTHPIDKLSDDELLAHFSSKESNGVKKSTAKLSTGAKIGAGIEQGIRDTYSTLDPAAQWIENKLGPITLGGTFSTAKDVADQNQLARKSFEKDYGNSVSANLGRAGGNILATLPILGAGGKLLGAAGSAVADAAPSTEAIINFLKGVGEGGKITKTTSRATAGAIQGAAANALISGGSDKSIGEQAGEGALIGAPIGVAAPMVMSLGKDIAGRIGDMFSSPQTFAINKLIQASQRDQIPIDEVINRLSNLGDQASITDAGGKNILRLADTVANVPGEGQQKMAQFLNERQAGQNDRLMNATASGLNINPEVNYEGNIAKLIDQRKESAAPLYKQAFEAPPVTNERVEQFLKDPVLQSGLKKGLQIQRLESLAEGNVFNPNDYAVTGFNEAGDPIISGIPNMRLLDAGKKGLDSIIAENTDNFGRVNEYGRAVTKVKNSYLNELDSINPDYAAARASYSEPSQSLNAIDKGKNFVKNGSYGNAQELAKMSDQDKQFFRIGAGKAISDLLDGTREGSDAASKLFATPKMQKALESVFPNKEAFDQFSKTVKDEIAFYGNRRAILGGSPTAPRLASMADVGESAPIDFGDIASAAKGNYGRAALSVGSKIKNKLTQMSPEKADAITSLLLSTNKDIATPNSLINNLSAFSKPRQSTALEQLIGGNYLPITTIGTQRFLQSPSPSKR